MFRHDVPEQKANSTTTGAHPLFLSMTISFCKNDNFQLLMKIQIFILLDIG
jgi:hypothetical protein